ncbi:hypothetical protein ORM34_20285 [Bacillus cereus]|uniref:hypothetical protein n=1 Tax=Bacillus cereus TaxID=1396 RepID=UPI002AC03DE1|nr:hypothetical protein [Bacillus cereus]MDZ4453222.1 hypothetical protein [Bacillus cereus]
MDKYYVDERVSELGRQIYELEQSIEGLKITVSRLSESVETKTNKDDVQRIIRQSELVKKINESEPIRTDCKVSVNLDGMVMAESIVERTKDGFKMSANDIRGVY